MDKQDSPLVRCIINDTPECQVPIKVGPGGYSVLRHFRLWQAASLQFVENEIKRTCRALPCNQDQRLALSIIPTLIDAGSGVRFGFWFEGVINALSTLDLENLEEGPVILNGEITVYQHGTVIEFVKKKDNIVNFVDCNNVEVDLEEPNSDPLDDPLEPEVQEIKIEDVKIEFEGDVSWYECFKDVLNSDSDEGGEQEMEEVF